jgi:hypothetical protein
VTNQLLSAVLGTSPHRPAVGHVFQIEQTGRQNIGSLAAHKGEGRAMQSILQQMSPDLELRRLEHVLRLARDRLALIIRMVPDPAVLKAAEDLCAESIAAVGAYTAMQRAPQPP